MDQNISSSRDVVLGTLVVKIFGALLLGAVLVLILAQHTQTGKKMCGRWALARISHTLGCSVYGHVTYINFFFGTVTFADGSFSIPTSCWSWSVDRVDVYVNWLNYLLGYDAPVYLQVHGLKGTRHTGLTPLQVLANGEVHSSWHGHTHTVNLHIADAMLNVRDRRLVIGGNGDVYFDVISDGDGTQHVHAAFDMIAHVPSLKRHGDFFIVGSCNADEGLVTIKNNDRSIDIDPLVFTPNGKIKMRVHLLPELVDAWLPFHLTCTGVTVQARLKTSAADITHSMRGQIEIVQESDDGLPRPLFSRTIFPQALGG